MRHAHFGSQTGRLGIRREARSVVQAVALCATAALAVVACGSTSGDTQTSGGTTVSDGCPSGQPDLLAQIKSSKVLSIGAVEGPPHALQNLSTGAWSGSYVDLMRDWASRLHVQLQVVSTTFADMVAGLQAHQFDFGISLNDTPTRAQVLDFSIPVTVDLAAFAFEPAATNFTSWDQLNNSKYTVGVILGSAEDLGFTAIKPNVQIVRYPTQNDARLALLTGKINADLDAWEVLGPFADANKGVSLLFPPTPIVQGPTNIGMDKGYCGSALSALNTEIKAYQASGAFAHAETVSGAVNPLLFAVQPVPDYVTKFASTEYAH